MTPFLLPRSLQSAHRLMGAASFPEAVAVVAELGVIQRGENLSDRLLDDTIEHGRYAQGTLCPVGLVDEHPAHRRRAVGSFTQIRVDPFPVLPFEGREVIDAHRINTGCATVGFDPLPCPFQIRGGKDLLDRCI